MAMIVVFMEFWTPGPPQVKLDDMESVAWCVAAWFAWTAQRVTTGMGMERNWGKNELHEKGNPMFVCGERPETQQSCNEGAV